MRDFFRAWFHDTISSTVHAGLHLVGRIRLKLILLITGLLTVATLVFSIFAVDTMKVQVLDEILKRAESLGRSAAAVASYSILSGDMLGMDNLVSKIRTANDDVEYVVIANSDGKVLGHSEIRERGKYFLPASGVILRKTKTGSIITEIHGGSGDLFEVTVPIMFKEKRIGTVGLGINESVLVAAKQRIQKGIFAGFVLTLFLSVGCIIIISSFVMNPVKELSAGVKAMKSGKKPLPLRIYSNDEFGQLTEQFNEMTRIIDQQQNVLVQYADELEDAYVSTVRVLAAAIDARDPFTLGHSTRVARFSKRVGEKIGMRGRELEELEIACLFHDVGKLKTPDYVLLKDGSLDSGEYREIIRHPEYGAEILSRAPSLSKYIPAVKHHHEWYNGKGYPDGLSGEDIPLNAAIISVADAYDAMTSNRPYKHSYTHKEALQELILFAGKQFDPRIVDIFLQIVNEEYSSQGDHIQKEVRDGRV